MPYREHGDNEAGDMCLLSFYDLFSETMAYDDDIAILCLIREHVEGGGGDFALTQ